MIKYNEHEMRKIQHHFPHLYYESGIIKGAINFSVYYRPTSNNGKKTYSIVECLSGKERIQDAYEIEIDLRKSHVGLDTVPEVREVNGRIEALARECGLSIMDLHLFQDTKSCCLGIFSLSGISSLSQFVIEWVYPYFVWQAYFEKNKKIPPCGEYSHGKEGYQEAIEDCVERIEYYKNKIVGIVGRNDECLCGSNKKYKKCCLIEDESLQKKITFYQNQKIACEARIKDNNFLK